MTEPLETSTVGDIVAVDFRAAAVFEELGIDFCCGGRQSLGEACRAANVQPRSVIAALIALDRAHRADGDDLTGWGVDDLIDVIVTRHHAYVRSALPTIAHYLEKLDQVHGSRHPELAQMARQFEQMGAELEQHMMKEEQVLFPHLRRLARLAFEGAAIPASPFGTVQNPIRMMEREHVEVANNLRAIKELSGGFVAPADGCATYAVCMAELARFERELHQHVHLENNVLFPKAGDLERRLYDRG